MLRSYVVCFLSLFFGGMLLTAQEIPADLLNQARALYFAHQPAKALQQYIEISKQTKDRRAFLNAAFIALELHEPKKAVDIALAGYHLYPKDEEILDILAEAFLADGQYAAAERILSLLPQRPEKDGFLYINLARAQMGLGETKLATYNLKQAASAGGHTGLANYLLGRIYVQEKQYKNAVPVLEAALAYDHQFTEARRLYAQVLEHLNRLEEAQKQYRIIYAAEKNDPLTNQAIARLKPKLPPEEKRPSTFTISHTFVQPLPQAENSQKTLKIGLGVRPNGKPESRTSIVFSVSDSFKIVNDKNIKITSGKAGETWKAVLEKKQTYLVSAAGEKIPFKKEITVVPLSNDATKEPTFILKDILTGAGMTWMNVADKEYRGRLQILHNHAINTLVPVNIVPLDAYLLGVIASEMPTAFPLNALRAQAVLARTYALKHIGKHKSYGYDLCDSQNCQVYGGVLAESEGGNEAVTSTLGEILTYEDTPIESVFSANTGGMTQSSKNAGWNEVPYLQPVSDYKQFTPENIEPYQFKELLQHPQEAYSKYDKNVSLAAFRWTRVVDVKDLQEIIKRKKKDIGSIVALLVQARSESGYVSRLLVKGTKGELVLNKENIIRNNLSLGMLRSSYFVIEPNYEKRKLKYFVFYGGGWGHGVGFDQTGAAGRAEQGQDYHTILHHYFPLATLQKTSQ